MSEATRTTYTDMDLLYAATARCRCGAGMAYPLDTKAALSRSAWDCSKVLRGEGGEEQHDSLPFAFWKVREETSINNAGGYTTRPEGTVARTVGEAACPKCSHVWKSEPYSAPGASHHWLPGPCPNCGYAVGGGISHSSKEGEPIESRYRDVVVAPDA